MRAPDRIGRYRIERLLGTGSFASVWLGYDETLDARVAIKVLADNWSHDVNVRERFLDEARLLWQIDDEHVVRVHNVGELEDGRPYVVMAWADGGSLRDRLADGPLPTDDAVRVLREVAAGVAVLHDHGFIHRDVTPGNVLFRRRRDGGEQVLVADLGLAKAIANASGLTVRAGTPGYMAPEQDDPASQVSPATDVYALGVLGAEVLTGHRPSGGRLPTLPDAAPVGLGAVLASAVSPDPAARPPDAAAFGTALTRVVAGSGPSGATPASPVPASLVPARPDPASPVPVSTNPVHRPRRRVLRVGLVAVGLLVALGIGASVVSGVRNRRTADASGRISVAVPGSWRSAGGGWAGHTGSDGRPLPGLAASPDLEHWQSGGEAPGLFVGLGEDGTPAQAVRAVQHPGCRATDATQTTISGVRWHVLAWEGCANGVRYVEAARPGGSPTGYVYVQVKETPGGPTAAKLLARIRVAA